MSWSSSYRKAARVFPVPVGARMSVSEPAAMAGQPARWGAEGSPRVSANQVRTSGWKGARASTSDMSNGNACRVACASLGAQTCPLTHDRAELVSPNLRPRRVESILLEAARLDEARGAEHRSVALAPTHDDALTLGDIERAAAEAGISRGAVSAASLRVAL